MLLHTQKKPIKNISFEDDCHIIYSGPESAIKLISFDLEKQTYGKSKELKMTFQCRGMKIDGVIRENIEKKRLQELIDKAN